MDMKSYEGQTFMTQIISKRVYASSWSTVSHPPQKKGADVDRQGFATTLACPGGIAEAVDKPCDSSANPQVLRLASTAGSLHKRISTAPGGFVSNIWIVCKKCRGAQYCGQHYRL